MCEWSNVSESSSEIDVENSLELHLKSFLKTYGTKMGIPYTQASRTEESGSSENQ